MKKYLLVTLAAVSFAAVAADAAPAAPVAVKATSMTDSMKMSVVTDFVKSMGKRDAAMLLTGSLVAYLLLKADLFGQENSEDLITF